MALETPSQDDPAGLERTRSSLRNRMQHAVDVCEREGFSIPANVRTLVDVLLDSANLEQACGDSDTTARFLLWAVTLCEEQLAERSADTRCWFQRITALRSLVEVHAAAGNFEAAAECCQKIVSATSDEVEHGDRERQFIAARALHELATIRADQQRLDEAEASNTKSLKIAAGLAEQFPEIADYQSARVQGQQLQEVLQHERLQLERLRSEARMPRRKTTAAIVAIVVIGVLKMGFLNGWFGGNRPPQPAFNPGRFAILLGATIEYVNDAAAPCSIRLIGYQSERWRSYGKEVQPGATGRIRESIEPFVIEQIVVRSGDRSQTSDVRFELPMQGLVRLKVDPELNASIVNVSHPYQPQGRIAKPTDDGPRFRPDNRAAR